MKLHGIKFEKWFEVVEEWGFESCGCCLWFLVKNLTYPEESILNGNRGSYVPYLFNYLIIVSIVEYQE